MSTFSLVSPQLATQLSPTVRQGMAAYWTVPSRNILLRRRMFRRVESLCAPDVTFTVFGPSYIKPRSPHLVGFAVPRLIYPESRAYANLDPVLRLRIWALDHFKKWHIRRADFLVVESETVRARAAKYLRFPINRILVVKNTCSPSFETAVRHSTPTQAERFRILVPASFYPHKNLTIVPSVAYELTHRTTVPFEFTLTLPPSSPAWSRIRREAAERGVSTHVRTVGSVPHQQFAGLYRNADAVFLPTLLECSTAVYPESMAAKVPVVTSDLDFSREACGDAALYFRPESPAEGAAVLAALIADTNLRQRLIEEGTRMLASNYPTAQQKFEAQLACIRLVAEHGSPAKYL